MDKRDRVEIDTARHLLDQSKKDEAAFASHDARMELAQSIVYSDPAWIAEAVCSDGFDGTIEEYNRLMLEVGDLALGKKYEEIGKIFAAQIVAYLEPIVEEKAGDLL